MIDPNIKTSLLHDLKRVAHLMNELHAIMCKTISDLDKIGVMVTNMQDKDGKKEYDS